MVEERQKERDGERKRAAPPTEGTVRGGLAGRVQSRGGERGGEKERERRREGTGLDLSTRRLCNYFSVSVSSNSRERAALSRPLTLPPPSRNPSICTLPATVIAVARSHLSAHRSRSLRGTLEWPRRLSALSARLIHHSSPLLSPRTSREHLGERGWVRAEEARGYVHSTTTTILQLSFAAQWKSRGSSSLSLSSGEFSRVKPRGQPSTLMRYRGALTIVSSNCEEERALLSREYNDSTIRPLGSDRYIRSRTDVYAQSEIRRFSRKRKTREPRSSSALPERGKQVRGSSLHLYYGGFSILISPRSCLNLV